jgi:hypothetical protein
MAQPGRAPVSLVLAVFLFAAPHAAPQSPAWDDLSVRGFAQELLFGYGTQRTHRFDDYTEGSYHLRPAELAVALPKEVALYKLSLQGLLVFGPAGPLWSYDVIALLQEEGCTRVNWLVVPHARITIKRSGCLPAAALEDVLTRARALVSVTARAGPGAEDQAHGCILLAEYGSDSAPARSSKLPCDGDAPEPGFESLNTALSVLYKQLQVTYYGYPPQEDDK